MVETRPVSYGWSNQTSTTLGVMVEEMKEWTTNILNLENQMTFRLNLPDWETIDVQESEYDYAIHANYLKQPEVCLKCGVVGELYRHGVKKQRFMDLPVHNKRVGLIVHRQRYHCRACGKTSFQPLPDMNKQHSVTDRLLAYITKEVPKRTFVSIADDTGIHERSVRRIFSAQLIKKELKSE